MEGSLQKVVYTPNLEAHIIKARNDINANVNNLLHPAYLSGRYTQFFDCNTQPHSPCTTDIIQNTCDVSGAALKQPRNNLSHTDSTSMTNDKQSTITIGDRDTNDSVDQSFDDKTTPHPLTVHVLNSFNQPQLFHDDATTPFTVDELVEYNKKFQGEHKLLCDGKWQTVKNFFNKNAPDCVLPNVSSKMFLEFFKNHPNATNIHKRNAQLYWNSEDNYKRQQEHRKYLISQGHECPPLLKNTPKTDSKSVRKLKETTEEDKRKSAEIEAELRSKLKETEEENIKIKKIRKMKDNYEKEYIKIDKEIERSKRRNSESPPECKERSIKKQKPDEKAELMNHILACEEEIEIKQKTIETLRIETKKLRHTQDNLLFGFAKNWKEILVKGVKSNTKMYKKCTARLLHQCSYFAWNTGDYISRLLEFDEELKSCESFQLYQKKLEELKEMGDRVQFDCEGNERNLDFSELDSDEESDSSLDELINDWENWSFF